MTEAWEPLSYTMYIGIEPTNPLWQFDMNSKLACRPGPTAVRGCRLIEAG